MDFFLIYIEFNEFFDLNLLIYCNILHDEDRVAKFLLDLGCCECKAAWCRRLHAIRCIAYEQWMRSIPH